MPAQALIITSLGSHALYGFAFTPDFVGGTLMVVLSIFLYNGQALGQGLHACFGRTTDAANRMRGYRTPGGYPVDAPLLTSPSAETTSPV